MLTLSAEDLNDLAEITYATPPTVTTPLLINVTGTTFNGDIPNQAGIGGSQAPYILWNFPDATAVTVTGGATLEGTLYAPNAALTWLPSQNIEGNIIAASSTTVRGRPAPRPASCTTSRSRRPCRVPPTLRPPSSPWSRWSSTTTAAPPTPATGP